MREIPPQGCHWHPCGGPRPILLSPSKKVIPIRYDFFDALEVRGIEPLSENPSIRLLPL